MKCPKCGYNSFEYYNTCKRCSEDLSGYKQTYNITPLVFPSEAREKMVAEYRSAESVSDNTSETAETYDDIFSFDLPDDVSIEPVQSTVDPFNFDEPVSGLNQSGALKPEHDVFADLLESTSQSERSPFTASQAASAPAAPKAADSFSGPDEFDLDGFSWDDAPDETTAGGNNDADFDSLFGDTKGNTKK